jgi:hypothetical protein
MTSWYKCVCGKKLGTYEDDSVVSNFTTRCYGCKRIVTININADRKSEIGVLKRPESRTQSHLVSRN